MTSVGHSYPYPELLEVLYAGATKTRGTGTACLYLPRNFWKFCTPVPQYPELLQVLQDFHTRTWNFWMFCASLAIIPGVRVQHVLYPTGASGSSVCLCHNTRNFWKFCNTSIPVPETSGSSVRPPYSYPESTNPTEHDLGTFGESKNVEVVSQGSEPVGWRTWSQAFSIGHLRKHDSTG